MKLSSIYSFFLLGNLLCNYIFGSDIDPVSNNVMLNEIAQDNQLTEEQKRFLIYENFVNDSIEPSNRKDSTGNVVVNPKFNLYFFKVPVRKVLEYKVEDALNPFIREALVFKDEDGQDYLKWPIYPEDRKYYLETIKLLQAYGLSDAECQAIKDNADDPHGLDSYLTASRSMLLRSRKNGVVFTVKVSTNYVSGNEAIFIPKNIEGEEAFKNVLATKYVHDLLPTANLKNLILWKEPLAFSLIGAENVGSQGMIIRDLQDLGETSMQLPEGSRRFSYIPGFSILQERDLPRLKQLAAQALDKNIQDISNQDLNRFALDYYVYPVARAMAELLANFGIMMISIHGQNVLLQIDSLGLPTGKIVLRDFTDSSLIKKLVPDHSLAEDVIQHNCFDCISGAEIFFEQILIGIQESSQQYLKMPSWYSGTHDGRAFSILYSETFANTLSEILSIPENKLGKTGDMYDMKDWKIRQ